MVMRAVSLTAVVLVCSVRAQDESLPPEALALLPETPTGFERTAVAWDEQAQRLAMQFAEGEGDRVWASVAPLAGMHEFWRTPVTWRRELKAVAGHRVLVGATDQKAGPDHRGMAGAAWHTGTLSIQLSWDIARGGPRPSLERPESIEAWAKAVDRGDPGKVPTALLRALLAKHPSALAEGERGSGPEWVLAEFQAFWQQFGERLRADGSTAEVVPPGYFPFGILFLERMFTWELDRTERLRAYARLLPWAAGLRPTDFVWDRARGGFLLDPKPILTAPLHQWTAKAPAALPLPTRASTWQRETDVRIVYPKQPLMQLVTDAAGRELVFVVENEDDHLVLTKLDSRTGKRLAGRTLPFSRIKHMRWLGGELRTEGHVADDGRSCHATIALSDLAATLDVDSGPLNRAVHPVVHGQGTASYLFTHTSHISGLYAGETADFVGVPDRENGRHLLYALEKDRHRARWRIAFHSDEPVTEAAGHVYLRIPAPRGVAWGCVDSATGKPVWSLAFDDHTLRSAGLAYGRLLLVGTEQAIVIDPLTGNVSGRIAMPDPALRTSEASPALRQRADDPLGFRRRHLALRPRGARPGVDVARLPLAVAQPTERPYSASVTTLRALTAASLALAAMVSAISAQTIALVGGAVIDGTGRPGVAKCTIVVDGERIAAVGPDVRIPEGAEVVDVAGKTVIPGLFDMHGHYYGNVGGRIADLFEPYARLYLAGGVTTTFSPGDHDPAGMVAFRERVRRGEAPGPRILTAGPYFDYAPSAVSWIGGVADADATVKQFRAWQDRIDGVKVYTSITEAQLRVVLDAAHSAGLRVTGHLGSITASRAIEMGIDRLEHGLFAMTEFAERSGHPFDLAYYEALAAVDLDGPKVQELVAAIVKNEVVIDPTIVILQFGVTDMAPVTPHLDRYVAEHIIERNRRNRRMSKRMMSRHGEAWPKAVEGALAKAKQFAALVHDKGGIVVAGTDPVAVTILPGWGLHRELQNLVEGGMTPLDALRCASWNAARALGLEKELGTIAAGKRADLVVVDGDPSADLAALARITAVYRDGKAYDPGQLRAGAEGAIR